MTGDELWDGVASLVIAALLAYVAVVLGRDTKELLIGESADPSVRLSAYDLLASRPEVEAVAHLLTMQLGPTSVLVAARVRLAERLTGPQVAAVCAEVEAALKRRHPDVTQVFIDVSGAEQEDADLLLSRLGETVDEVRALDGDGALPAAFRSRTVRRAAGSSRG